MIRLSLLSAFSAVLFFSCISSQVKLMESVLVNDVEIAAIPDGSYTGSYIFDGFTYSVRCVISEGRMDKIKILQNKTSSKARLAETIIPRVIEQQKVNVEPVAEAVAESKVLLKAIERALTKNSVPAE
jgi:uncharacterized protein with FMN-binding domain